MLSLVFQTIVRSILQKYLKYSFQEVGLCIYISIKVFV